MYLAAILELYSRAVVGWSMNKTLDSQLAMNALDMAIRRRGTGPQILHSDQGSTYSTAQYREMLAKHAIRQSMSRKGDCWDNAPIESFFHSLKTELVMHCDYKTREEARASLFDYLEVFYNVSGATRPSNMRPNWSSKHQQPPNRHVSAVRGQDQCESVGSPIRDHRKRSSR